MVKFKRKRDRGRTKPKVPSFLPEKRIQDLGAFLEETSLKKLFADGTAIQIHHWHQRIVTVTKPLEKHPRKENLVLTGKLFLDPGEPNQKKIARIRLELSDKTTIPAANVKFARGERKIAPPSKKKHPRHQGAIHHHTIPPCVFAP
ncbi:MAG: hypothetical protein PHU42_02275 [Patescibacteria group bacterium]|nr:hypothetical protein [Patescibacteria group bacterium]